jgi:hypothetical protein
MLLVTMADAWHSLAQDQENIERVVADLDAARAERRAERSADHAWSDGA